MCGIAGWIVPPQHAPSTETTERMLRALAHRGPDDSGMAAFDCGQTGHRVQLGHRRLSIIDPQGARQPMHDAAAGLTVVFNGEIYNFRELRDTLAGFGYTFDHDSDTEVLLRAYRHWGIGVAERLRGMFAFAIWDARRERLVLARDRFGEKPLYLHGDGSSLFFSSEIKALLEVPGIDAEVDLDAVWQYLAYRYVPGPATLFSGIRKLPPATVAVWQDGELQTRRYWQSGDRAAWPGGAVDGDVVDRFLAHLDEAVHVAMVSDVPYGAFLSGGLDSSTIVALMRRHSDEVRTFSTGFDDAGYSELPHAAQVARRLGTEHHEIVVNEQDMIDRLPELVGFRDAPVAEPSDIPIYLLAREAAGSVRMVLTGEGSDELLGGYPKHAAERCVPAFQALPRPLRRGLIAPLVAALPYRYRRVKTAVANLDIEDRDERHARWFGALNAAERARLAAPLARRSPPQAAVNGAAAGASALRRILYFDQTSWLPDNLLERGDRMTMAASIEARVPFLDYRLADFVATLPDRCRVRGWRGKWILRQAARRLLPPAILERPKVGFRVPVNEWFRGPMRDFLLDHLRGADSRTRQYYDPAELDRVIDEHLRGRQNHEKLLWSLLNLEIWHRRYV